MPANASLRARDRGHSGTAKARLPSSHRIAAIRRETEMNKLLCLMAAAALFAPFAMSVLNQASQMIA
jgi:hypothetical protein